MLLIILALRWTSALGARYCGSKESFSEAVGPEARKPCWRRDRAQEAASAALEKQP